MSRLDVFHEQHPGRAELSTTNPDEISAVLGRVGVRFEQWPTRPLPAHPAPQEVLDLYRDDISRWLGETGYQTVDVVSMHPAHPDREALRKTFLSEHTHGEDEVRFFASGQGLFTLHIGEHVHEVLCKQGDLISVPAGTPHWFDMGLNPEFVAIRFFNNPDGWVAQYTGSDIADLFSRLGTAT